MRSPVGIHINQDITGIEKLGIVSVDLRQMSTSHLSVEAPFKVRKIHHNAKRRNSHQSHWTILKLCKNSLVRKHNLGRKQHPNNQCRWSSINPKRKKRSSIVLKQLLSKPLLRKPSQLRLHLDWSWCQLSQLS